MKNPVDAYFKKFFDDLYNRRERRRLENAISTFQLRLGQIVNDVVVDMEMYKLAMEYIENYRRQLRELNEAA